MRSFSSIQIATYTPVAHANAQYGDLDGAKSSLESVYEDMLPKTVG